jgi:hypothetical protein
MITDKQIDLDINVLLDDYNYFELMYVTLIAWNMNMRKAKLVTFDSFRNSIISCKKEIVSLSSYELCKIKAEEIDSLLDMIEPLFKKIHVMQSKSKIVGVSKTLHFLLPKLIMPIDRTYTLKFMFGHMKYDNKPDKEYVTFKDVFKKFWAIVKNLSLNEDDLNGKLWNTTVPKLVDNAIIGFTKKQSGGVYRRWKAEVRSETRL